MSNHAPTRLTIEALEPRMMLSTVSIFASGQSGEETLELAVRGQVELVETNVATSGEVFTFDVADGTAVEDLQIAFTNDLYLPEQGIDRNLVIEKIVFDGQEFLASDPTVFSTGTWLPQDGVAPGTGRGGTLHANGFLRFLDQQASDLSVSWQGETWTASEAFGPDQISVFSGLDEVSVSGVDGPISLSREFDVTGNQLFRFSADSYRNVIEGDFSFDNQPWATIGVNFYNDQGVELEQQTLEFNSDRTEPADGLQSIEFVTPENATSAFAWIWIDAFEEGVNIPIVVRDVQLSEVDTANDTTPPIAVLPPFSVTSPTGNEINFIVEFSDDFRLGSSINDAIRVTGPNGFDSRAVGRAGGPVFNDQVQQIIFGLVKDNGDFGPADNGIYTVELVENALFDVAGNVAAPGVLGTFEIGINANPAQS